MKYIFVFILITSCDINDKNLNQFCFYGKFVQLPNYYYSSYNKTGLDSTLLCDNNLFLKDSIGEVFISIKLCGYSYGVKPDNHALIKYFREECQQIKEEKPDLIPIENKTIKDKKSIFFNYEYFVDNFFYSNTYIPFDKCYLSIKLNTTNQNNVEELQKTLNMIIKGFGCNPIFSSDKIENNCLSCNTPFFW